MPISGYCVIIQLIRPLATRGTLSVFVRETGYSRNPDSATQARPVISPVPLRINEPAGTFLCQTSSRGMTTVTPVRIGPCPGFKGPSPEINVVWPTFTPATSVIALKGPGGYCPTTMPRSRRRWRSCFGSAATMERQPEISETTQNRITSQAGCRPAGRTKCGDLNFMRAAMVWNPHIDLRMFRLNRSTQGKSLFLLPMHDENGTGRRVDGSDVGQ